MFFSRKKAKDPRKRDERKSRNKEEKNKGKKRREGRVTGDTPRPAGPPPLGDPEYSEPSSSDESEADGPPLERNGSPPERFAPTGGLPAAPDAPEWEESPLYRAWGQDRSYGTMKNEEDPPRAHDRRRTDKGMSWIPRTHTRPGSNRHSTPGAAYNGYPATDAGYARKPTRHRSASVHGEADDLLPGNDEQFDSSSTSGYVTPAPAYPTFDNLPHRPAPPNPFAPSQRSNPTDGDHKRPGPDWFVESTEYDSPTEMDSTDPPPMSPRRARRGTTESRRRAPTPPPSGFFDRDPYAPYGGARQPPSSREHEKFRASSGPAYEREGRQGGGSQRPSSVRRSRKHKKSESTSRTRDY